MATLSKNARVLQFLAQTARRPLTTFQLQKFPYIADIIARQQLGHPLTQFDYIWYDHGPFDSDLYTAMTELQEAGVAEVKPKRFATGRDGRLIRAKVECNDLGLSAAEEYILTRVCRALEKLTTKQLRNLAYQTAPMKALVERDLRGHRLPMEMVDRTHDEGCDLERAVARSIEIEEGRFALATEFFDALRTKAIRRDAGANI